VPPYNLDRFSERLAWSTPITRHSLLLQEKRLAGAPLVDLTTANPTEVFPNYPHQEIAHAYGAILQFRYEPDALGSQLARQTIADWYLAQGIPAQANRMALTASTSEAYAVLFKLLCNPGDDILIPRPSYPLFDYLAQAEAVNTVPYQLSYDGAWYVDFDSLQKSVSPRTKAIVIVNPNNPTGSFLKLREWEQLAHLAEIHNLAIISDEVFMTYPVTGPSNRKVRSLIGYNEVLSFSLNGLSKAAGMPQMKLGWIAVNGPQEEIAAAMPKLELLLDNYLSVATPVQAALPELLRIGSGIYAGIANRLCQNRQALAILENSPVTPLGSEGGWSIILQVPNIRWEEEWIRQLLTDEEIVVQPGYFYDMPKEAFLVLSLLSTPPDFAHGLAIIKRTAQRC
jgi:alanine-synthesizing transaminase